MGSSSYLPASMDPPGVDYSLYLSDLIPGSPSAYLDLPPTPHHEQQHKPFADDQGGGGDSPSSMPEDLVLPFISRMLMEEDIDEKFFYDYPDNAALQEAQQPFLHILSDPSSTSTSDNSNRRVASPCSPSDGSSALLPAAVDSYDRFQYEPVDLDPAAFFSAGANSHLMNSAFLKGMEEASKFLPTQDKLVIDIEAPSGNFFRGLEEGSKFLSTQEDNLVVVSVKKEEAVDAALTNSLGGRGRKNPHREDELEDGRSSKQTAMQGDDVTAREVFEKALRPSDDMCVDQLQNLRIAMQEEVAKNEASGVGKGGNGKERAERPPGDQIADPPGGQPSDRPNQNRFSSASLPPALGLRRPHSGTAAAPCSTAAHTGSIAGYIRTSPSSSHRLENTAFRAPTRTPGKLHRGKSRSRSSQKNITTSRAVVGEDAYDSVVAPLQHLPR